MYLQFNVCYMRPRLRPVTSNWSVGVRSLLYHQINVTKYILILKTFITCLWLVSKYKNNCACIFFRFFDLNFEQLSYKH